MLYEETTTGSEISLIDFFLEEQTLTAVEKFARLHDSEQFSRHQTVYQDLIPLEKPGTGQQFAFAVDLDKCSGCKACVTACHNMNGLDDAETWRSVGLIHDKETISQKLIFPQLVLQRFQHKYTAQPISLVEPGRQAFQQNVTTACHHCVEPGCLSGCPVKAYEKDPLTGIVKHLDDQCIGCKYCTLMCPYDVPQYNPKQGIVRKCDMCSSRLAAGEAPACVQSCPTRAIRITVVETAQVKATPADFVAMPGVADPQHTYPTTAFKSKRNLLETMQPSDHYFVEPEDPEYPLLLMLILTQLSAGLFLLENILHLFGLDRLSPVLALVALVSGLAGLGVAQLHLGRPLYAFRSFLGLKTSWLSREVVAAGLFVGLAALYTGLIWWPSLAQLSGVQTLSGALLLSGVQSVLWTPESGGFARALLGLLVAASGLLTVSCSAMVYQVTPRPFWRDGSPFVKFFLTTLILGSVTGLLVGALVGAGLEAMARPLYGLLMAATAVKLWYEARSFAHAKAEPLTSLKKSALLMKRTLLQATQTRFISAVLGAILLPLALWGNTSETGLAVLAVMMFLLTVTGEALERYLFFSCAVAPRMPGHPVRRR